MNYKYSDDQVSDDEVYFGRITLKEIKKRVCKQKQRRDKAFNNNKENATNGSFKIIEAHSTPNLNKELKCNSPCKRKSLSASNLFPKIRHSEYDMKSNDSFLQIEEMVSQLCVSQKNEQENEELENTLDVIEYILDNGPLLMAENNKTEDTSADKSSIYKLTTDPKSDVKFIGSQPMIKEVLKEESKASVPITVNDCNQITPKMLKKTIKLGCGHIDNCTPTPSTNLRIKGSIFKTPGKPLPHKNLLTPSKKSFQHIVSPVASYINQSPVVPLVKNVHPKKPLPGSSAIPKLIKTTALLNTYNKENVKLPSIAYKSAKQTKLLDIPDDHKLPQNQWAKQVATSIQKAVVIQHNQREMKPIKKPLSQHQEDSFADLTLLQADVSVCTKKSAMKTPKKF